MEYINNRVCARLVGYETDHPGGPGPLCILGKLNARSVPAMLGGNTGTIPEGVRRPHGAFANGPASRKISVADWEAFKATNT